MQDFRKVHAATKIPDHDPIQLDRIMVQVCRLLILFPICLTLNGAVNDREGTVRRSAEDKKKPCKNCEGKGTLKKGDKIVRCQRCGGTGIKPS
jgi:hypothetical protein